MLRALERKSPKVEKDMREADHNVVSNRRAYRTPEWRIVLRRWPNVTLVMLNEPIQRTLRKLLIEPNP